MEEDMTMGYLWFQTIMITINEYLQSSIGPYFHILLVIKLAMELKNGKTSW